MAILFVDYSLINVNKHEDTWFDKNHLKMVKKKVFKSLGSWKSVPLEGRFFGGGGGPGELLGIEELTHYQITDNKKVKEVNIGKEKKKKRKKESTSQEDSPSEKKIKKDVTSAESAATAATEEKEKKKKKKKKKKRKKKTENESEEEEELEWEDEDETEKDVEEDIEDYVNLPGWDGCFVSPPILRCLKEEGFYSPTVIQKMTLPAAIQGRLDVLGAAETGSGKTLAFGIPIIQGILKEKEKEKLNQQHDSSNEQDENEDEDEVQEMDDVEMADEDDDEEDNLEQDDEELSGEEGLGCVRVVDNCDFDFDILPKVETIQSSIPPSDKKLRALILTPTRELAVQIKNHLNKMTKYTDIKIAVIVGGMAPQKQIRILSKGPEIVVATPGRLWDLITEGNPHLNTVKDIGFLAIDETDRMVEKGHFEELQKLLELINDDEEQKKNRQTFVFSATLSLVHEAPKHSLKNKKQKKKLTSSEKLNQVISLIGIKPKHKLVDITRKIGTAETLTESRIHCGITEKDYYLYYFLQQHPGRTLIFCNSIDCVRRLVNLFGLMLVEPLGLHAQMHQKQRLKNLERFSADSKGILIATDVAARGLDIPNVEHVIHYQVPRTSESYIHRSGRTARASKEGLSVMMIEPKETMLYKRMCKTLNRDEDLPLFPIDSGMFSGVKVRVNVARELDKLKLTFRKEEVSKSWWKKTAEEAELEYSDSDNDSDVDICASKKVSNAKIKIENKTRELHSLLLAPLMSSGFSGKYPTKSGKLEAPSDLKKSAIKTIHDDGNNTKKLLKKSSNNVITKKKKVNKKKKSNNKN